MAIEGKVQAKMSIQPYQTFWLEDEEFMKKAFEESKNGINYYDLIVPDGDKTLYWVASRYVNIIDDRCIFYVGTMFNGKSLGWYHIYDSCGFSTRWKYGLFPVVSLNYDLLEPGTDTDFIVH